MTELLAKFRALFPEFDFLSDAVVLIYLESAGEIFGACSTAQLWLAAHLIALDQANQVGQVGDGSGASIDGGNGEINMEKVGELQVSLKTMADRGLDTYYTTTPYGRRYLAYRAVCPTYVYSPRTFPKAPIYYGY